MSYELVFAYELQVTVYCTGYKLLFVAQVKTGSSTMTYDINKDYQASMIIAKILTKHYYSLVSVF